MIVEVWQNVTNSDWTVYKQISLKIMLSSVDPNIWPNFNHINMFLIQTIVSLLCYFSYIS